jgi:hypothetical protein
LVAAASAVHVCLKTRSKTPSMASSGLAPTKTAPTCKGHPAASGSQLGALLVASKDSTSARPVAASALAATGQASARTALAARASAAVPAAMPAAVPPVAAWPAAGSSAEAARPAAEPSRPTVRSGGYRRRKQRRQKELAAKETTTKPPGDTHDIEPETATKPPGDTNDVEQVHPACAHPWDVAMAACSFCGARRRLNVGKPAKTFPPSCQHCASLLKPPASRMWSRDGSLVLW